MHRRRGRGPNPREEIHENVFDLLAVYALGAVSADEVEEIQRHLRSCPLCQQELEHFAATVRLLPELTAEQLLDSRRHVPPGDKSG